MTERIIRIIVKTLIAVFCVWHMVAVGIYSLVHVEHQPILNWLDSKRSYVKPYVLTTSQWQRWNLFSPDPLRRVIQVTIAAYIDGNWQNVAVINRDTVSFLRRASELKTLRRMEDEEFAPLQERYIADYCKQNSIPAGTPMKMEKQWFVIPKNAKTQSKEWWNNWEPNWKNTLLVETTCPPLTDV